MIVVRATLKDWSSRWAEMNAAVATTGHAMRVSTAGDHDRRIAAMFDRVSPRYDLLNRVLSLGTDLSWRRRAVALGRLGAAGRAVDVGAGTGDLTFALARASGPGALVIALDLSKGMLDMARRRGPVRALLASAGSLPFADGSLDRVVTGFTVRNVADLPGALREFRRVLRPGGRAVILELSHPRGRVFPFLYRLYFEGIAPRIAVLLGGDAEAYRYLPRSLRAFPAADALAGLLRDAGFREVRFERLTLGIAAIHVGDV